MTSTITDPRPTTRPPASERAHVGALLFDRAQPGWAHNITRPIEVDTITACPVAQAFGEGSWTRGYWALVARLDGEEVEPVAHGFLAVGETDGRALDAAWTAEVAARGVPPAPPQPAGWLERVLPRAVRWGWGRA
jgi:hypothetical protein